MRAFPPRNSVSTSSLHFSDFAIPTPKASVVLSRRLDHERNQVGSCLTVELVGLRQELDTQPRPFGKALWHQVI